MASAPQVKFHLSGIIRSNCKSRSDSRDFARQIRYQRSKRMATAAENMTTPTQSIARQHKYHAKAYVLQADLKHPVQTVIDPQALVDLPEDGKYTYAAAPSYKLDGIISYRSAY